MTAWQRFRSWPWPVQGGFWLCCLPIPLWIWALTRPTETRSRSIGLAAVVTLLWLSIGAISNATQQPLDVDVATTASSTSSSTTTETPETDPPDKPTTTSRPTATTSAVSQVLTPALDVTAISRPASPADLESLLDQLQIDDEHARDGYDRDLFEHWITQPDGCNTRQRVLIDEATTAPTVEPNCKIVGGTWISVYDAKPATSPSEIEIDHVVALAEAWDSGAWSWDPQRREDFANDLTELRTLRAVTAASNKSKGDRDPGDWTPPEPAANCDYATDWVAIKIRWKLSADKDEVAGLRRLLTDCYAPATTTTPPPPPPPPPPPSTTATTTPPTAPPTTQAPIITTPPPPTGNCHPSYPTLCLPPPPPDLNCADVGATNFPVLPPDPHGLDGNDNDGIGCES